MANNTIAYSARTFDEYRSGIIDFTRKYYPDVFNNLNDASVGSWFIDILSDVADNLSYNIDRAYQETSLDSAQQLSSILSLARTHGCKVPGKKAAIVEIELSCNLPIGDNDNGGANKGDESYAPYVRRGTLFSTGLETFELMNDVDFSKQFDENGVSNRQIIPLRNSNGNIYGYRYAKLAIAMAGHSKIYKTVVTSDDVKPFMQLLLKDTDILGVESIITKHGSDITSDPSIDEFYVDKEQFKGKRGEDVNRFFEVDNLIEQYRFATEVEETTPIGNGVVSKLPYYNPKMEVAEIATDEEKKVTVPCRYVCKGKWERFKNKFITEYTDNWSLKITFGKGIRNEYGKIPDDASNFTQYVMSRMVANDYMGVLPEANSTMYVLYRVGGGEKSNIAAGTLTNIIYRNVSIAGDCKNGDDAILKRNVLDSLSVINTTPSYGGKDEPSIEEIKYLIKYNSASQNRCVTLHDYEARLMQIPAKFGSPFRTSVIEENNKIIIYTLGLDENGKLRSALSEQIAENMKNYLSRYRMINDFVEIRSGKVINIGFEIDIFVDKTYDKGEVVKRVIDTVYDYMDIHRHLMGEDIFIGDLESEISKLDGVQNLIELRAYNYTPLNHNEEGTTDYSYNEISQEFMTFSECEEGYQDTQVTNQINLKISDKILFSDSNSMFEIKHKEKDIKVTVKQRQ